MLYPSIRDCVICTLWDSCESQLANPDLLHRYEIFHSFELTRSSLDLVNMAVNKIRFWCSLNWVHVGMFQVQVVTR